MSDLKLLFTLRDLRDKIIVFTGSLPYDILGNYILFDTKTRKRRHTDRAFSGESLPYLRINREIIRKFLR